MEKGRGEISNTFCGCNRESLSNLPKDTARVSDAAESDPGLQDTLLFSALPFLAPGPLQAAPGVMRGLCPGYYSGLGGMPSVAPGRGGSARSLSHAEAQGAGGTRPALWVMPRWTLDTVAGLHGSLRPGLITVRKTL